MTVDLGKLAAQRRAAMDGIVIDNPRAREAHKQFEYVIEHSRQEQNRKKLCCVPLIAQSQTGKSTIIESFVVARNTREALEQRRIPILQVTLEANTTRKGMAINILEAIADYGFQTGEDKTGRYRGTETTLLSRVRQLLKLCNCELLVLDEVHHLIHSESEKLAESVGEAIKRMLIKGVCPIVLSGVEDARQIFQNKQLLQRAVPAVNLAPLSATNPADLTLLIEFLAGYVTEMETVGAATNATVLLDGDIPSCLLEVSQGVLGAMCNLLKEAVRIMTYAGKNDLDRSHLVEATENAFVRTGLYGRNPFLHGFAPLRAAT
ncbi:MAG TPA: TniB family NTP-binding protein [Rhizomicrobium sp.]|nr:TniB family NTP-binding protein [Rhizomicrobium sp.]